MTERVASEELQRRFNTRLATWGDRTTGDILGLVGRTMLHLPQGTAQVPEVLKTQLRVVIGFAIREAALAGMQLQARKQNPAADAAVMREDKPLVGVTATARRVVSDLRPREHITQRFPAVVPEQRWEDETTEVMGKHVIPDVGDE